jgi:hypothetical protein
MTKKKAKLGRPKLPGNEAKAVMLCARFTKEEAGVIASAVNRSGKNQSEWVRNALLSKASGD